jgi:hypothetical protein
MQGWVNPRAVHNTLEMRQIDFLRRISKYDSSVIYPVIISLYRFNCPGFETSIREDYNLRDLKRKVLRKLGAERREETGENCAIEGFIICISR